jgi:hypothetical protein
MAERTAAAAHLQLSMLVLPILAAGAVEADTSGPGPAPPAQAALAEEEVVLFRDWQEVMLGALLRTLEMAATEAAEADTTSPMIGPAVEAAAVIAVEVGVTSRSKSTVSFRDSGAAVALTGIRASPI